MTDHLPSFLIFTKMYPKKTKTKIYIHYYSKLNQNHLTDEVSEIDWQNISTLNNVDDMFDSFYTQIDQIVSKHVPILGNSLEKKEK